MRSRMSFWSLDDEISDVKAKPNNIFLLAVL